MLTGRRNNMKYLVFAVLLVLAVSLCEDGLRNTFNSPPEVIRSILTWIRMTYAEHFHTSDWLNYYDIVGDMPYYGGVIIRIKYTAITFMGGMLLALSGAVFQTVFRNPMAAPTMLGVSTGINIGVLALVVQFGTAAAGMMGFKYLYCYTFAILVLALVLGLGKISSGRGRMSVFDLILVGAVISQIFGGIMTYFSYALENDVILIYQEIMGALNMDISSRAFAVMGAGFVVSVIPMMMIRFSFNAVAFENDDTRSLGVNAYAMKIITLVLGTLMITVAMIHCGTIGMISLIAPFISRALLGADFRKLFWGNMLIGGATLVICKDVVGLIPFGTSGLPLGTVVDFVMLPLFVVALVSGRKTWNEA